MIGAMLPMTALTCPMPMLGRMPLARLPYLAQTSVTLRPLSSIRPARLRCSALAATLPAGGSADASNGGGLLGVLASTLTSMFPVAVLGVAAYSVAQQSALAWVQPALLQPALGVAAVGLVLTLTFEDATRSLSASTRSCARALLQYAALPAMGYLVSTTTGMPQELCVWLCLASGCIGSLIGSLWGQKAVPVIPTTTSRTATEAASIVTATTSSCCCCSKPAEASAAPIAVAEAPLKAVQAVARPIPASVEAFIARWGSRAGIEAAAGLATTAAAASSTAATAADAQPVLAAPAKLREVPTPASVIAFIERWGKRDGIDAAAAAAAMPAGSLAWAQAAAEKSLQSTSSGFSSPAVSKEEAVGVLVAAAVAVAASPSSRSRAGMVSFQGPSGSGLAAWLPEAAAKASSSNGSSIGSGKVKEAVAKLEAAFAKPSAPEAPATSPPQRADMNDFRRWGPRRSAGSSTKPSPATSAASLLAAAPEFDALAPFLGSIRISIAEDLVTKWGNGGAPAAPAASGNGSNNGIGAKQAEYDALAPFVGSIRLDIANDLVSKWTQPAAAAPQDSGSTAAVASLAEAAPKPAPKPVPRPALEPFAGNIRLELAQHYTKLWSAAQQGQEHTPGVGGDSQDALAPFAGSIRSNMAQHYTTLWAAPARPAAQPASAAPAAPTAPAMAAAPAASAIAATTPAMAAPVPVAATLAMPLTGVGPSGTTPASVRAFISRWGTPEGIQGAAARAQHEAAAEAAAAWVKGQLGHVEAFLGGKGRFAGAPEARVLGEGISKAGAATAVDPRLASAPESVQTFISRWGTREGIEAAAQEPGPEPRPLLEVARGLLLRWTGLIPSPAVAEEGSEETAVKAVGSSAARLAQAPASVQSFITRWGTRDGIEAAAAATTAAALASEHHRVLAMALLPQTVQQWRSVGEQAHEIVHAGRWAARIQGPTAACAELSLGRRWRALAAMDEPPCAVAEALLARGTAAVKPATLSTPPSVHAFIARWGSREGIEAAAGAAAPPAGVEVVETFPTVGEQAAAMMGLRRHGALGPVISFIARWTGLQPAYAPPARFLPAAAVAEQLPALPLAAAAAVATDPVVVPVGESDAAAGRLARAPESVQAFIARWGRREGIDAASQ